jgi:hypothetical protein
MRYKRFVVDVPEDVHTIAKRQAKDMNITLRKYLLKIIYPIIFQREEINKK